MQDFKNRLANYERASLSTALLVIVLNELSPLIMLVSYYQVYEPVKEGSYIKMIDMVSGHGGQIQVSLKPLFVSLVLCVADNPYIAHCLVSQYHRLHLNVCRPFVKANITCIRLMAYVGLL